MALDISPLIEPARLWTRAEVLDRVCPVPAVPGVYGWFFSLDLGMVPLKEAVRIGEFSLLYAGISPKRPSIDGRSSRQALRSRVRYHFRGNAEGSTLRLTLGCLLSRALGIELRRVGSGKRMTFGEGEKDLSEWMERNARVAWLPCENPWLVEENLIRSISLPLNLDQNRNHSFHAELSEMRRLARARARELSVM